MNVSKLNQKQLEMLCEKALRELNLYTDPYYLYSLQLVDWLLQNHDLSNHWGDHQWEFQERVSRMYGWKPEYVQKELHGELGSLSEQQKKPGALAMLLLENIEASLNI